LALFQIKHLPEPSVHNRLPATAKSALAQFTPLHRVDVTHQVQGQFDLTGSSGHRVIAETAPLHRFYNRNRDLTISYGPDSLNVEASVYHGWQRFSAAIRSALDALSLPGGGLLIDGIDRVGLRYLDEVRVPEAGREPTWADWIAPDLLPPQSLDGFALVQQQSLALYSVNGGSDSLALRYGAVNGPSAFASTDHLTRAEVPPGPYFLLDTDAFWLARPGDSLVEPTAQALMDMADRLHSPAKALFERSITEKLRREVLDHD
jgi:uncharacterized protein (TIGR04255 family)